MTGARFRHVLEWGLLRATVAATGRLPPGARRLMSRWLGWCAFEVIRLRRRVVLDNLALALGSHVPAKDLQRIGRRCYQELAMGGLEIAALTRTQPSELAAASQIDGWEHLSRLVTARSGCILVTGHLGNWELLAATLAASGIPLTAVSAPMHNPLVDRWLKSFRVRFGMELVPTGRRSGRAALRAVRTGRMLLLLIDQDARREGIFVQFFGHPASTRIGAAMLAQRAKVPILPCRILRDPSGRNTIRVHPPLPPPPAEGGSVAVRNTTQDITTLLEAWIRQHPSAWFWPHRRFKTQPSASHHAGHQSEPSEGGDCGTDTVDRETGCSSRRASGIDPRDGPRRRIQHARHGDAPAVGR